MDFSKSSIWNFYRSKYTVEAAYNFSLLNPTKFKEPTFQKNLSEKYFFHFKRENSFKE